MSERARRLRRVPVTKSSGSVASPRRIGIRRSTQPAVGRRIRTWRGRRGISQQRLADLVGVTQAALSNYETGKRDLPLTTFVRIAVALDVAMQDLLGLRARPASETTTVPAARRALRAAGAWNVRGGNAEAAS